MNKKKNEIISIATFIFFVLMAAYAIFVIATQDAEIKRLKAENKYSGSVFSTVQIWNEETGAWDTYQGTLDFDCGLNGEWLYEVNGLEAVLTGARLIGSVVPEGEHQTEETPQYYDELPTYEEGTIVIYTDTYETYKFHGLIVKPVLDDEVAYYMPTAELIEFVTYYQEGESENEE